VPLIVLDANVLADAIEGHPGCANLLTWLAYGKVSLAVEEREVERQVLASTPGARQGGPSRARPHEAAEAQWTRMNDVLDGLPDDWGLVTSQRVLRRMLARLQSPRAQTRVHAGEACDLVKNIAAGFAGSDEAEHVRKTAEGPITPLAEIACAKGADFVVTSPSAPRAQASRLAHHLLDPIPYVGKPAHEAIEALARLGWRTPMGERLRFEPAERPCSWNGHEVTPITLEQFWELPEVPDLRHLGGTLNLLRVLFLAGAASPR
jgi:hypothetical protein